MADAEVKLSGWWLEELVAARIRIMNKSYRAHTDIPHFKSVCLSTYEMRISFVFRLAGVVLSIACEVFLEEAAFVVCLIVRRRSACRARHPGL